MKIEIEIPDDELRTCVSCSSGEMNLTLNVNETIDGYDITSIESDTYDGNASLKYRKVEDEKSEKIPFTEDQFFRITTNVRILSRNLPKEGHSELQESIDQLIMQQVVMINLLISSIIVRVLGVFVRIQNVMA